MAYEIKKKDSSEIIEPEVVQVPAEPGKNSVLSAEERSKLIDGGLGLAGTVAKGAMDIAKIREQGNQEVAKIRAQTETVIADRKSVV